MNRQSAVRIARRTVSSKKTSPKKVSSAPPLILPRAEGPRLLPARAGDHPAIHSLLVSIFHGPSAVEFQSQLDEPGYDPADRLVVKHGERVGAHVRLKRRQIAMSGVRVPAVKIMDLATAPEYRGRGMASSLLAVAERRAHESGVLLGLTRTRAPALFARSGWAICGQHSFSLAGARQILAHLSATGGCANSAEGESDAQTVLNAVVRPALSVRPLRRIELPALARIYAQSAAVGNGWPIRSDDYWEWLHCRQASDRAYVAIEGPEPSDPNELLKVIRGYAFIKDERIVELLTEPGRSDVAEQLAARACADASEQNHWQLQFDAPHDHTLHELFTAAGGQTHRLDEAGGEVFMAKVFDPRAMLVNLAPALIARAQAANLPSRFQFGIEFCSGPAEVGARRRSGGLNVLALRLVFTPRGLKVVQGPAGRPYLRLRREDAAPLLSGCLDLAKCLDQGRLASSGRAATKIAATLFPRLSWWNPPLDDLLA